MKKEFIDTHAHLYLDAFDEDRNDVVVNAVNEGVTRILLPNIDSGTLDALHALHKDYPLNCFPMIGLHPTSVKQDYEKELKIVESGMTDKAIVAIGEIGIDLYWDKTYFPQQQEAFRQQLQWGKELDLPVVIHARDSFNEIFEIMDDENDEHLNGVFHSFTGDFDQAERILDYGFYIGINGIVTFKNAGLDKVVEHLPPDRLLIETDSPFLAPVPRRGKRNESAFVKYVAAQLAEIFNTGIDEIAETTTRNAMNLFKRLT